MATYTLELDPNPPEDNVTSYNAYEHDGANYNLLGQFDANLKFDLGQPSAAAHAYAATAVNARGESDKSSDAIFPAAASAPKAPRLVIS
jgi:hypothetical protein